MLYKIAWVQMLGYCTYSRRRVSQSFYLYLFVKVAEYAMLVSRVLSGQLVDGGFGVVAG